jgi:hypothetical protein
MAAGNGDCHGVLLPCCFRPRPRRKSDVNVVAVDRADVRHDVHIAHAKKGDTRGREIAADVVVVCVAEIVPSVLLTVSALPGVAKEAVRPLADRVTIEASRCALPSFATNSRTAYSRLPQHLVSNHAKFGFAVYTGLKIFQIKRYREAGGKSRTS